MSPWWILVGFGVVVAYEVAAVFTAWPTISQYIWAGLAEFPQLGFLAGLGIGLLLGHLFL